MRIALGIEFRFKFPPRSSSQLFIFMNLLAARAYRMATKIAVETRDQTKRKKKEEEPTPIYSDQFNRRCTTSSGHLRAALHAYACVTSETRRGFPCGWVRMRVQNTLHRVAKRDRRWVGRGLHGNVVTGGRRGRREREQGDRLASNLHAKTISLDRRRRWRRPLRL